MDNEKMKKALEELKSKGITHVMVEFSGEGDDGSINEINYTKDGSPVDIVGTDHGLDGRFHELAYEYLDDNVSIDWVNNEGGGGTLDIDLSCDKFKVKLNAYSNLRTTVDEPTKRKTL